MKKLDFSKLPKDTPVFLLPDNKKGKISGMYRNNNILVEYENGEFDEFNIDGTATFEGYLTGYSLISTRPFDIPEAFCDMPIPSIKVGEVVFVRDDETEHWLPAIFYRFDGNTIVTKENDIELKWNYYTLDNPYLCEGYYNINK